MVDSSSDEDAEEVGLVAMEAEADDVKVEGSSVEIYTLQDKLSEIQDVLADNGVTITNAEISLVPKTTIMLSDKEAEQTLRLLDALEELEDIQKAYTNADFSEEVLVKYSGQ